jgi:RHS repeat-associated protein
LTHINSVSLYGGGSGGQQILTPGSFGTGTISGLAIAPYIGDALAQGFQQSETAESQALLAPPMMDNNADLFSQAITYGNPDSRTRATAQYNGNISSTTWQVAGRAKQSYGFTYDDLNRLTEATYFDITDNGTVNSTFSADNKFKEKLTYDLRGNITTLQRNGLNGGSWTSNGYTAGTYGLIDNLAYTYGIGNQLTQVTDYSLWDKGFKYKSTRTTGSDTDYRYDANGNLTYDRHKNISAIEYNYLNLPLVIRITHPTVPSASGSIEFVYDALGTKLRKIVKNNTGGVLNTYDYGNGVEYKDRVLQRIAHSEGAVVRNDFGLYQQEYVLRDHLGNTRVTFRDGVNRVTDSGGRQLPADPGYDDGIVTKDDIVQINHFYPFGLNMEGDWNGAQGKNKYQYNGKEWNDDFGLGWNHHDWRFYDVAIGRFVTIDPECETEEQESWNPYHFGYDDPIRYNDPDGRFPIETIWDIANVIYDAGKAVYHSIEGDWSKARSASADLAADVAATLIPYVPAGASKLIKGADGALDASRTVTNLEKRAKIIQEAQVNEKARNLSTTAVAKAKDANGQTHTLVASSRERLTPAQRKVLKKNEIEVKGKGHAETTIVNHADKNNLKVTQIAASRPVCKSCQTVLEAKKIKIKSPLKEK